MSENGFGVSLGVLEEAFEHAALLAAQLDAQMDPGDRLGKNLRNYLPKLREGERETLLGLLADSIRSSEPLLETLRAIHGPDFIRCASCNRLGTRIEHQAGLIRGDSSVCPCGGRRFSWTNPAKWEWWLPRVLGFRWRAWRGKA